MKNIFYLLFFFSITASASDTIPVWHVFYNKNKIKEYNHFNKERKIIIKLNEVKPTDSITINYFFEGSRQKNTFAINSNDSTVIDQTEYKNTFTFPVSVLLDWRKKKKLINFKAFNYDWSYRPTLTVLLFEIELK